MELNPATDDDFRGPVGLAGVAETVKGARLFDEEITVVDRESLEEKRQREEAESIELARQLMAEEAMASYQNAFDLLRESSNQFSQEDYDALQAALEEDQRDDDDEDEVNERDMSYDTMLQLSERIGDVKSERWALKSSELVAKLPSYTYDYSVAKSTKETDDSGRKCLVCQCDYEIGDQLRGLPCGHCFHKECVDMWLKGKDACPYCRQTILALSP